MLLLLGLSLLFSLLLHMLRHRRRRQCKIHARPRRGPYLAFEAEPRWVSHYDIRGPCGMISQWATVLTITANPAVPKLDPNSRAAREAALRAELAEDRY